MLDLSFKTDQLKGISLRIRVVDHIALLLSQKREVRYVCRGVFEKGFSVSLLPVGFEAAPLALGAAALLVCLGHVLLHLSLLVAKQYIVHFFVIDPECAH